MAVPKLKRVKVPGLTKLNDALEEWATQIERSLANRGRWPIMVSPTPTGNLVSIDMTQSGGLRKMVVTTQIGKKVGAVCGDGGAKPAVFDEDTSELTEDTDAEEEVIYSDNLDKAVKVGAVITAALIFDVLWVITADSCGNLE